MTVNAFGNSRQSGDNSALDQSAASKLHDQIMVGKVTSLLLQLMTHYPGPLVPLPTMMARFTNLPPVGLD